MPLVEPELEVEPAAPDGRRAAQAAKVADAAGRRLQRRGLAMAFNSWVAHGDGIRRLRQMMQVARNGQLAQVWRRWVEMVDEITEAREAATETALPAEAAVAQLRAEAAVTRVAAEAAMLAAGARERALRNEVAAASMSARMLRQQLTQANGGGSTGALAALMQCAAWTWLPRRRRRRRREGSSLRTEPPPQWPADRPKMVSGRWASPRSHSPRSPKAFITASTQCDAGGSGGVSG